MTIIMNIKTSFLAIICLLVSSLGWSQPEPTLKSGSYKWLSKYAKFELSSRDLYQNPNYLEPFLLGETSYEKVDKDWAFVTRTRVNGQEMDTKPYAIVDLGDVADIRELAVENSIKLKDKKLTNGLTVWVSKDKEKWQKVWKAENYSNTWAIKIKKAGRYIKLGFEEERTAPLLLKRIKVFGNELKGKAIFNEKSQNSIDSLLANYTWISKEASFKASSQGHWDTYSNPTKFFDGSPYRWHWYDYAFHTRSSDKGQIPDTTPFVIVDLEKEADLQAILVRNRMYTKHRSNGLVAWVSSDKLQWKKVDQIEIFDKEWCFSVNRRGRYIKLGFEGVRDEAFHLQSFWAFGEFVNGSGSVE